MTSVGAEKGHGGSGIRSAIGRGWPLRLNRLFGPAMSLIAIAGAAWEIRASNAAAMAAAIPHAPLFWILLVATFLAAPAADWMVFRLLWGRATGSFEAVLRRAILNSAVLSYLGDAYLLTWARDQAIEPKRALSTIRDVALISAIVGGIVTLALATFAWPAITAGTHALAIEALRTSLITIAVITLVTIAIGIRTIALLPREMLVAVAATLARTFGTAGLMALLWHLILPDIGIGSWITISAIRLMFLRLPLIPNKEVAFAATAAMVIGGHSPIVAAITLVAFFSLLVQLACSLLLMVSLLARKQRSADIAAPLIVGHAPWRRFAISGTARGEWLRKSASVAHARAFLSDMARRPAEGMGN